ncbi:hypothetical protein IE985_22095 [Klebsiella pneumoniae]|nr:hypothetical protein [Klebsiella pneumoniae]
MKQAQRKQPVVSVDNAPGEVIILPPVQVRRTTPTVTRWLRELTSACCPQGWGWVCCCWLAAGGDAQRLSHAAEHAGLGADPVCRSVLSGRAQ